MRALTLVLTVLLAGCGSGPVRSEAVDLSNTDEARVTDRLYVARDSGLAVVNVATGTVERELPLGLMSPDRSAYWTVESGATTTVKKLDPTTGGELGRITVAGAFDLPTVYGPLPDALSSNGRYLVLESKDQPSTFSVLDLRDGKERARAELQGWFTFDAIDDLGQSLYLLEYPQPGTSRYNVRLFEVLANRLAPNAIVDAKSAAVTAADLARGTMTGIYHASATAGQWHLGLYVSTARGGPVVHALNMDARWAFCLLELAGAQTHRNAWAIAATPKKDRAFAVNAASGAFASIDPRDLKMATRTFRVQTASESDLRGSAVVSADGTRLYATGGKGVLVVDAHTLAMKGQYLTDRAFTSVMVSSDGTRLYALDRDGAISRIEPGTGRDLGVVARLPNAVGIVRLD